MQKEHRHDSLLGIFSFYITNTIFSLMLINKEEKKNLVKRAEYIDLFFLNIIFSIRHIFIADCRVKDLITRFMIEKLSIHL
jgi:hypothetical protein